jgi:hypothetical protein
MLHAPVELFDGLTLRIWQLGVIQRFLGRCVAAADDPSGNPNHGGMVRDCFQYH